MIHTSRPVANRRVEWLLRGVLALASLVSAALHGILWVVVGSSPVGPLFALNAMSGLAIAAAVLSWRHRLPVWFAIDFGVATFASYVLATVQGVGRQYNQVWTPPEIAGMVTDVLCVVVGLLLLTRYPPVFGARPREEPGEEPASCDCARCTGLTAGGR
ncbi:hypothetical protein [Lentzea sp. NBRC 102530]|uniref:hypothetical protein n=1 Tax=Lentzea sp. NBRC 102530 TaxID=3032201 RepID=UPI0024A1CDE2|nr:hypothetical protein [Lentzea sp. NBRC 102530]GLY46802.1 hypothetical protein Lesp01_04580 [Lentzea sp. NBRC 102530]